MLLKSIIKNTHNVRIEYKDNGYNFIGKLGIIFLNLKCKIIEKDGLDLEIESLNKKFLNLSVRLIKQTLRGVSVGYKKRLRLKGLGYSAEVLGDILSLKLGYSNKINIKIPESFNIKIKKRRIIYILGYNLVKITDFAAFIRSYRVPDCYKGKGVLYYKENIKLKVGKKN